MSDRNWVHEAIARIEADFARSADTHLIRVELPAHPGIDLYLKDESTHPTGSLKHRLARSLFLYGLCNGWIGPGTTLVESSSGSTAVSEAYFARLLGLPFIAVMPRTTSPDKIAKIEFQGGRCHFVDRPARGLRREPAARGRGRRALPRPVHLCRAGDRLARQQQHRRIDLRPDAAGARTPCRAWVVCGAGTGGTSATIGRFIRYRRLATRLCVVDPERSVFHRHWADRGVTTVEGPSSCIEGIGRPRVEPSFMPALVDRMIAVPDEASLAAMRVLGERLGRRCGGSTGTNLWGCARAGLRDGGARRDRLDRLAPVRSRRALPRELLRRWLDQGAGAGAEARAGSGSRPSSRAGNA